MNNLPEGFYSEVHKTMPIICVDVVVSNGTEVLLIKRDREPEKGTWWFPGGRLLKSETLRKAATRIVKNETNLEIQQLTYLGLAETQFSEDPFGHGQGTHTINAVYLGRARETSIFNLILDDLHIAHEWIPFAEIYGMDYHPYVKRYAAFAEGVIKS